MAHFAQIGQDNIVTQVIVADREFVESGALSGTWIQTSYNTFAGEYTKGATKEVKDFNKALGDTEDVKARNRKHYAGVGYYYDPTEDAFVPPQPYPSWKLNKDTYTWEAPKKIPEDGNFYEWNEDLKDWIATAV